MRGMSLAAGSLRVEGRLRSGWVIVRESAREWLEDRAPQLSAAVAYYTIFSLAPLLVIAVSLAGFFFGEKAARGEIVTMIDQLVGSVAAEQIQTMIEEASRAEGGVIATALGIAALLFGASGVFFQLSRAMDQIWGVTDQRGGGLKGFVKNRLVAFALVLSIGFLLLVSLVVSALLAGLARVIEERFGGVGPLWQAAELGVSFAVITILFAVLYRYLPSIRIDWRYLWAGAAVTSLLFAIGKFAIGMYLGRSSVASTFGAAGSLAVVLIWIYYSTLIFLFGAEMSEVIARRRRHAEAGGSDESLPPRRCASDSDPAPQPYPLLEHGPKKTARAGAAFAAGALGGAATGCLGALTGLVLVAVRGVLRVFRRSGAK